MEKRRLSSYYGMFATYGCCAFIREIVIIKRRIEMLNGEKFKKEIEDADYVLAKCKGKIANCRTTNCGACDFFDKERDCVANLVKWLIEEYKEPILNEKEKEILNKLIEANRLIVNINLVYVKKVNVLYDDNKCYLCFAFENHNDSYTVTFNKDCIFKAMEVDKEYSLEDLGLC